MPSNGEGIVGFLRARWTEARDKELARQSIPSLPFRWTAVYSGDDEHVLIDGFHRVGMAEFFEQYGESAADPDVLADLSAKLAILDEHPKANGWDGHEIHGRVCRTCGEINHDGELTGDRYPCRTLRLLAMPFATHPDYDTERWRP